MMMPGRNYSAASGYRYGFNGKERDDELSGEGNKLDFEARVYDSRLGRFLSLDPLMTQFPAESNYSYAENDPISNIDLEGERVTWWFTLWRHKQFNVLITNLKKTEVFKTIFKRFIKNQDNLVIKPAPGRGYNGMAYPKGKTSDPLTEANRYVMGIGFDGFRIGDELTADPTLIVKSILHEGLHLRYMMARAEGSTNDYPTLKREMARTPNSAQADHEVMGYEASRDYLIKGMKQFDAENKTTHSNDWYDAMIFYGSLTTFNVAAWQNLDPTKKTLYQNIINNEVSYNAYLTAKAQYKQNKTAVNKTAMDNAKTNVNWTLFKQTRKKSK
jgi:RHS repeat-associated protein